MTSKEMQRKIERIILDVEELADENYLDSASKNELNEVLGILKVMHPYSMDLN